MGTVVVVEDDELLRFVIVETLREGELDVIEHCCADDALSYLQSQAEVAVVFTDINMPGAIDGLGLARAVKASFPATKVIVTSGRPRSPEELDGLQFVMKPYAADKVLETIRSII